MSAAFLSATHLLKSSSDIRTMSGVVGASREDRKMYRESFLAK